MLAQAELQTGSVSVILLAGGVGKRMGVGCFQQHALLCTWAKPDVSCAWQARMPKQYMLLRGQPIATHSMDVFAHMSEVGEVVVVCEPCYRSELAAALLHACLLTPLSQSCLGAGACLRTTGGKS